MGCAGLDSVQRLIHTFTGLHTTDQDVTGRPRVTHARLVYRTMVFQLAPSLQTTRHQTADFVFIRALQVNLLYFPPRQHRWLTPVERGHRHSCRGVEPLAYRLPTTNPKRTLTVPRTH